MAFIFMPRGQIPHTENVQFFNAKHPKTTYPIQMKCAYAYKKYVKQDTLFCR